MVLFTGPRPLRPQAFAVSHSRVWALAAESANPRPQEFAGSLSRVWVPVAKIAKDSSI